MQEFTWLLGATNPGVAFVYFYYGWKWSCTHVNSEVSMWNERLENTTFTIVISVDHG